MREKLEGLRFAVVGATGMVGQEMLAVLARNGVLQSQVVALASSRSAGEALPYGRGRLFVQPLEEHNIPDVDVALFAVDNPVSQEWAPRFAAEGIVVIDNSSEWRYHEDVPLVVPEVNAFTADALPLGVIANPNCVTAQLVMALFPLNAAFGLESVSVSTYQAVSGAGKPGVDELYAQMGEGGEDVEPRTFAARIHGNVIPQIGSFLDSGMTGEEDKIVRECRKILGLPNLKVDATCVRVPVERGHSASVTVCLKAPVDVGTVRAAVGAMEGVKVTEVVPDLTPRNLIDAGDTRVRVGRFRTSNLHEKGRGFMFWCVGDNLGKGAALNAVQIAAAWSARRDS